MSVASDFVFVRPVDFAALITEGSDKRAAQKLLAPENGASTCQFSCIKSPPGFRSPRLHVHDVDQIFYLLSGTMFVEINGNEYKVVPGSLVVFPAGVPHRNWTEEGTTHLDIMAPLPDPSKPVSRAASPVED